MPPRIALVTTDVPELLAHEHDLEPLLAELARQGVSAGAPVWHDASVDWSAYDLIVMRSPWDYSLRWSYRRMRGVISSAVRDVRCLT